jgi:hypothetical protein
MNGVRGKIQECYWSFENDRKKYCYGKVKYRILRKRGTFLSALGEENNKALPKI